MCNPSIVLFVVSTCMRALYSIWHGGLGGVRTIHECYLHVCTVLIPLEQYFGVASTGNAPILPVLVLELCLCHCTVYTVIVPLLQCFGIASTGNVPILPVLLLVLCLYHCT